MIERNEYLNELIKWKDKDVIKVITGIRSCGKSTLSELFIYYLKKNGIKDTQILKMLIMTLKIIKSYIIILMTELIMKLITIYF